MKLALDTLQTMDTSALGNLTNLTAVEEELESDDVPAATEAPESDDVPAATEAPASDDVPATTTTAAPARKLRGGVVDGKVLQRKAQRKLQDISFLIGGNLTTEVYDAG